MYIPLPFPYCKSCGTDWPESRHSAPGCRGLLEIDPDTQMVHCTGCGKKWNIWDSEYHCVCGEIFSAKEIKEAVENLLEDCRLCADELALVETAYWKRKKLSQESRITFIENTLSRLGYSIGKMAGIMVEKIVEYVLYFFGVA